MFKNKLRALCFLLVFNFAALQSIAQVSKAASSQISFRPHITNTGLIFGSLSFPDEKANYNGYMLKVICISTDKKTAKKNYHEVRFSPKQIWNMKHKGELDNGLTYVFALDLPEGDYEISGIRLFTNSGVQALQRHDVLDGFSVPFTISKGEIKYVGNIKYDEDSSGGVRSVITYKNEFSKDLEAIKVAQPFVIWNTAVDAGLEITYKE